MNLAEAIGNISLNSERDQRKKVLANSRTVQSILDEILRVSSVCHEISGMVDPDKALMELTREAVKDLEFLQALNTVSKKILDIFPIDSVEAQATEASAPAESLSPTDSDASGANQEDLVPAEDPRAESST